MFLKTREEILIDVGGNIGLSTIGFRELGFNKNNIHLFEPDINELLKNLKKLKKYYMGLKFIILDSRKEYKKKNYLKHFLKKVFSF